MPYETISTKQVFNGKILDVKVDTIMLPNGKTALREVITQAGAAAILPVDSNGNVILVQQYRHPIGAMAWEIPAGMMDDGEDPLVCAAREMEEETGYKSDNITRMFSMYPKIGCSNSIVHIYKAENLYEGSQNLDPEEFIEVAKFPIKKAAEMIFSGKIIDAKTIAAVMAYIATA